MTTSKRLDPKLASGDALYLPPMRNWPKSRHVFEPADIHAINMALATGRPLLLRGEPGCGKSQLARAAAEALKWPFFSRVVNARFEPEDLLYRFDAVARLAKAQVLPAGADTDKELAASRFLLPEVLWWAFDPTGARGQYELASKHCGEMSCAYDEDCGHPVTDDHGIVVLIDEIDKADAEVPNSLLETLSLGGFPRPYGGGTVKNTRAHAPLIIITTNEDREMPPAFIRRCLVHRMDPKPDGLADSYFRRVRAHIAEQKVADSVVHKAVKLLLADREKLQKRDITPPGQAELLDLITAISHLATSPVDQEKVLDDLHAFTFQKHPED